MLFNRKHSLRPIRMTPNEIIVAYNDSRGVNAATSHLLVYRSLRTAATLSPVWPMPAVKVLSANTFGDPVVLYNKPSQTWFTVWLDGNGGCTLGGYKSADPADPNSWTHFCVHPNGGDDRESGWADNDPSSPFFGKMYVSWNDFNAPPARISSFRAPLTTVLPGAAQSW